ncbi:alpha/beta fold hydrolase [Microbacteriaceae bacterium 4G12]
MTRTLDRPRTPGAIRPRFSRNIPPFQVRRVAVDDLQVVVRTFGTVSPGSPVFVLVHGIGVSFRYFEPLAEELAKRGVVHLLDMPGYGSSPRPRRNISIAEHGEVLATVLRTEGIENPVLIGHSMGSQMVSEAMVQNPDLTDSVVLMGPTMSPSERTFFSAVFRLTVDMTREPLRGNWTVLTDYLFRCGPIWYAMQVPHLLRDRIEERVPRISARVLVIRGDRDPVVSRPWATHLASLAQDGRFAEVPGPHVVMFTAPEEISALVLEHAGR